MIVSCYVSARKFTSLLYIPHSNEPPQYQLHSCCLGLPNQGLQAVRRMSTSKATAPGKEQRDVAERKDVQFVLSS